jgi:tetratricopeptide (TPR) repeat protein
MFHVLIGGVKFNMQQAKNGYRSTEQIVAIIGIIAGIVLQPLLLSEKSSADEYNPAFARGLAHLAHRDYDDAIIDFNEAIGYDDRNPKVYFKRGQCFFNLNNYNLAIKDFDEAIKQNPDNSDFFLYRGTAYAKSGEDDQAIRDYVQAIRLDPKLIQAYKQEHRQAAGAPAGNRRRQQGGQALLDSSQNDIMSGPERLNNKDVKNKGAVEDYRIAMKLAAQNDAAYFNSGTAYSGITKPEDALKRRQPASDAGDGQASLNPSKDNALVQDVVDMKVEKPEQAIKDLSATIELEPTNDAIYYKRARAYQQLKQADKALRDFSEAIGFNPLAKYYLARAYLYHQIGKSGLAQEDIQNARSVDATLPEHITFEKGKEKW